MVFDFSKPDLDLIDLDRRLSAVEAVSPEEPAANSCLLGSIGLDGKMVSVTSAGSKKGLSVGADVGLASDRDVADYVLIKLSSDSVEEEATAGILLNVGKVASGDVAIVSLLSDSSKAWVVMKSGSAHFAAYARLDGATFSGDVVLDNGADLTVQNGGSVSVPYGLVEAGTIKADNAVTAGTGYFTNQISTKELVISGDHEEGYLGAELKVSEDEDTRGVFNIGITPASEGDEVEIVVKSPISVEDADGNKSPIITEKDLEEKFPVSFVHRAAATASFGTDSSFDLAVDFIYNPLTGFVGNLMLTVKIVLAANYTPTSGQLSLSWVDPEGASPGQVVTINGNNGLPVDMFEGLFMPSQADGSKSFGAINLWLLSSASSYAQSVQLGRFEMKKSSDGSSSQILVNVASGLAEMAQGTYVARYQVQGIAPIGKKLIS